MASKGSQLQSIIEDPNAPREQKSKAMVKLVSAYNSTDTADAVIADLKKQVAALSQESDMKLRSILNQYHGIVPCFEVYDKVGKEFGFGGNLHPITRVSSQERAKKFIEERYGSIDTTWDKGASCFVFPTEDAAMEA